MPGYGVVGPEEGSGLLPWSWAQERLAGQLSPAEEKEMILLLEQAEARLRLARVRRGRRS